MMPSKELTQLSVTTAAVLISLGIGRTAQTANDTYLILGNQPFSTKAPSSGVDAKIEAESGAVLKFTRRPLATVDNSIELDWLLDVPNNHNPFSIELTDQERGRILEGLSGNNITYTRAAFTESIQEILGVQKGIHGESIQRNTQTLTEYKPQNYRFSESLKTLDGNYSDADLERHDTQVFADEYRVGENHTNMNVQEHKVDNNASNAYIKTRRIAENVNKAVIAKISSVMDVKSERACY